LTPKLWYMDSDGREEDDVDGAVVHRKVCAPDGGRTTLVETVDDASVSRLTCTAVDGVQGAMGWYWVGSLMRPRASLFSYSFWIPGAHLLKTLLRCQLVSIQKKSRSSNFLTCGVWCAFSPGDPILEHGGSGVHIEFLTLTQQLEHLGIGDRGSWPC
jgi:hypothetical protein